MNKLENSVFDDLSTAAWKQNIQFQLEGADYQTVLHKSLEGFIIKPFYNRDDLDKQLSIPNHSMGWKISDQIGVYDEKKARLTAENALEFGSEFLQFQLYKPQADLRLLLRDFKDTSVPIQLKVHQLNDSLIESLLSLNPLSLSLLFDPIGKLYCTGNWYANKPTDFKELSKLIGLQNSFLKIPLSIDGIRYQEAGASMVQQLAYSLAHASEYLHYLEEKDQLNSLNEVHFHLSVGNDYFMEMAKIRALRVLWKSLAGAFNTNAKCRIHAQPSKRYFTLYNSNQNLVRSTTSCMSAALGGADYIANTAYDCLYKHPNVRSSRIARNQLLIAKHEAFLNQVHNPADGAYYIEALTEKLAQEALNLFKSIEKGGGFLKQLESHQIQKKIKEHHEKELSLFKNNRQLLIGTHAYKNPQEKIKSQLERNPFKKNKPKKTQIEPIVERRIATLWELKRFENE